MDTENARNLARDLIQESPAVYITTIVENGYPQTRAMLNLHNPTQYPALVAVFEYLSDNFALYLTTNTSSQKIAQIIENPKVAAYYCTPDTWRGVCLIGDIEVVQEESIKDALWQPSWNMYYTLGSADPDYAILRLKPNTVKGYHQMQFYQFEL